MPTTAHNPLQLSLEVEDNFESKLNDLIVILRNQETEELDRGLFLAIANNSRKGENAWLVNISDLTTDIQRVKLFSSLALGTKRLPFTYYSTINKIYIIFLKSCQL